MPEISFGKKFIVKKPEYNNDFTYRITTWSSYDADIEVFWRKGLGLPESTIFSHYLNINGGRSRVVKMRVNSLGFDSLMA